MNIHNQFILICQVVPPELSNSDTRISQAGNNYMNKLIKLLKPKLTISLLPVFLKNLDLSLYNDNNYVSISSNSRLPYRLHLLYRLLLDTFKGFVLIKKRNIQNILFYNLDKQNFLLLCLIKLFLKRKVFVLVADHWSFNNSTFFEKLINYLLKKVNGTIVLNSNIKVNSNQVILPGLLLENDVVLNNEGILNKNVLLSGSLGKTTGLLLALDCFSKNSDLNLYISGRPYKFNKDEFDHIINKYVNNYPNIHYLGLLSSDDYLNLVDSCDICLSLRNPSDKEHQFNFPSKILEYLSKSKIVVSSIKYNDIKNDDLLFISKFNSESLKLTLEKIYNHSEQEIVDHKYLIYKYILDNFCQKSFDIAIKKLKKNYAK